MDGASSAALPRLWIIKKSNVKRKLICLSLIFLNNTKMTSQNHVDYTHWEAERRQI